MKISVVSFSTTNYTIGEYTRKINEQYCKSHGYSFHFYNVIPKDLEKRHPAWCKLFYIQQTMTNENDDYIMWIDADAFFCNNRLDIKRWIDKSENKLIILSRDPGYSLEEYEKKQYLLNSGVMIFKNCDKNKQLLDYMLYDPIFVPNYNVNRSHNPNTGVTGWDQAAIRYCFMQNKYDMKENTYVNLDSRFNNNTLDVQRYIDDGGFIIHLTNFMGRFNGRSLQTINAFLNLHL